MIHDKVQAREGSSIVEEEEEEVVEVVAALKRPSSRSKATRAQRVLSLLALLR